MNKQKIALGLDVSKLKVDVCLLFPDGKKLTRKISNNPAGFWELASWLDGIDLTLLHACLEPTGRYSRPLAYFLCDLGISVSQVHTFAVMNHGRSMKFRSKSDRIDAFLLADYCMKNDPAKWMPPSQTQSQLRDIHHRLVCLDEQIRQEENRMEAGTDAEIVRKDIEENLGCLLVRRKKLEAAAKQLLKADERLFQNFVILKSIIGVGEASALRLLALLRFEEFKKGRQVACFAGLTPRQYESGTSIHRRSQLSKVGNSNLRSALYFPAMVAMQHNPQLREFADRLRAENKPAKVIICAVMRKLLMLAAALIHKQEMYNPEYKHSLALS